MPKIVRLGDVVLNLETGGRPKGGSVSKGVPSIGAEHLNNSGGFDFGNLRYVPTDYYRDLKKGKVTQEDILIVKDGATTGKVSFVRSDFPFKEAAINEHVFKITVDREHALPQYVFYYLYSPMGQNEILKDFRGATVGGITRRLLDLTTIPMPRIEVQRRVAGVLDKAQELIDKRKRQIEMLDEFLQSVFLDMFGDPVINPKGWRKQAIGELTRVETGSTPRRDRNDYYLGGRIPWVKTGEIRGLPIRQVEEYITERAILETNCKVFPKDTILVAMYGQGQTRGRAGIMKISGATNQACAAILPSPAINVDFLFKQLCFRYQEIRELGRGGNQANLNLGMVRSLEVIIPPVHLQEEFSGIVKRATTQQRLMRHSLSLMQSNLNSIMQRAFKGKLFS
ncbi:MAG: restriction endonuclease subunit S [Limnochordia bacterium]|jgi:type I restriction enzyme S subunit|nr:restriction endonuclease subunit S [Limnochordia bacterium]MDD4517829.1 restriction endonuclease subunit S [Limnochordia bacterium]